MPLRAPTLLTLAVALLPDPGGAQDFDPPLATVALTFAWPPGVRAEVSVRRVHIQTTGKRADTCDVHVVYDLDVAEPRAREPRRCSTA